PAVDAATVADTPVATPTAGSGSAPEQDALQEQVSAIDTAPSAPQAEPEPVASPEQPVDETPEAPVEAVSAADEAPVSPAPTETVEPVADHAEPIVEEAP